MQGLAVDLIRIRNEHIKKKYFFQFSNSQNSKKWKTGNITTSSYPFLEVFITTLRPDGITL